MTQIYPNPFSYRPMQASTAIKRLIFPLLTVLMPGVCFAIPCPPVNGLADENCDGKVKIVAVGDSLVAGIGDTRRKDGGGYVSRLAGRFSGAVVENLGFPGITSGVLLRDVMRDLPVRGSKIRRKLNGADIVILDVGRNDYFHGGDVLQTVRNLRRLVNYIHSEVKLIVGVAPVIGVAALVPTKRSFQRTFLAEVNELLLQLKKEIGFPLELRYDLLSVGYISFDGIHPTSAGYNKLARIAIKFIRLAAAPHP